MIVARAVCPVCRAPALDHFLKVGGRDFLRCKTCAARLLHPHHRPDRQTEEAHYLTHRNDPDDPDYRRFLSQLAEPLLQRLPAGASGLDFGCGPGPALAAMLREAGHEVALYDPFFQPDETPLEQNYDFVTCSETAEHFHHPADEFDRFDQLLRPGGWLALMTAFAPADDDFAAWHYHRDPTHVVFYSPATLRAIAAARGWTCEIPAANVALMQKAGIGSAGPDDQSSVRRKRNKARMVKTSTKISNAAISPDTAA